MLNSCIIFTTTLTTISCHSRRGHSPTPSFLECRSSVSGAVAPSCSIISAPSLSAASSHKTPAATLWMFSMGEYSSWNNTALVWVVACVPIFFYTFVCSQDRGAAISTDYYSHIQCFQEQMNISIHTAKLHSYSKIRNSSVVISVMNPNRDDKH